MRSLAQFLCGWALILAVLFLLGSCIRWQWNECRQVGHGKLYCATHMGKRR